MFTSLVRGVAAAVPSAALVLRAILGSLLVLAVEVAPTASGSPKEAQTPTTAAGITSVEITRVESPTFDGRSFGEVGQYEKLVGGVSGQVDPNDARNAVITDLDLAPRNAAGMVEYSADLYILRPVDPSKTNHRMFFEINNRGNNLSLPEMNDSTTGGND